MTYLAWEEFLTLILALTNSNNIFFFNFAHKWLVVEYCNFCTFRAHDFSVSLVLCFGIRMMDCVVHGYCVQVFDSFMDAKALNGCGDWLQTVKSLNCCRSLAASLYSLSPLSCVVMKYIFARMCSKLLVETLLYYVISYQKSFPTLFLPLMIFFSLFHCHFGSIGCKMLSRLPNLWWFNFLLFEVFCWSLEPSPFHAIHVCVLWWDIFFSLPL